MQNDFDAFALRLQKLDFFFHVLHESFWLLPSFHTLLQGCKGVFSAAPWPSAAFADLQGASLHELVDALPSPVYMRS